MLDFYFLYCTFKVLCIYNVELGCNLPVVRISMAEYLKSWPDIVSVVVQLLCGSLRNWIGMGFRLFYSA